MMSEGRGNSSVYSANGLSPFSGFPFVVSPQNLPALLQTHSSLQFFQSLLELLIKSENNPLLLLSANCSHDPLKQHTDIFAKLLLTALHSEKRDGKTRKILTGLLKSLAKKWSPRKHHYDLVRKRLAKSLCDESAEAVGQALNVLRIFSREDEEEDEVPGRFFFSPFTSGLLVPGPFDFDLSKGYSLILWVKLEDLQTLQRSQPGKCPVLFRLRCAQRTVEYYFSGLKLFLRTSAAKDSEIAILLTNTWYYLAISHSSSKELKVVINNEIKHVVARYPEKGGEGAEEAKLCENFAGQVSSVIVYRTALAKEQLVDIGIKLPRGLCSPSACKEVTGIPQHDICFAFSPVASNGNRVYDLHGESFVGSLVGNSGVVSIPMPSFGSHQQVSFEIVMPVLSFLKNVKDLKIGQKLFFKWLVTMKAFGNYLNTYGKNTIKIVHEYKMLKSMLSLNIPLLPPEFATVKAFTVIEEAVEQGKDAEKYLIETLFETRSYWNSTEAASKFWSLLKAKAGVFAGKEYEALQKLLVTMYKLSKSVKGICCPQLSEGTNRRKSSTLSSVTKRGFLNETYGYIIDFLNTILENINANVMPKVVKDALEVIVQKDVCHCLYTELLAILGRAVGAHSECAVSFDEMNVYRKLIRGSEVCPLETQIDCFLLIKKVMEVVQSSKVPEERLYKLLCEASLKRSILLDASRPEERKYENVVSGRKDSDNLQTLENEHTDEEHSTSLLQEKVLSEQNSINNTIKKMKQIKIDIQETTKSNSKKHEEIFSRAPDSRGRRNLFFEEFEISSTGNIEPRVFPQSTQGNHILSIEELVAQDPYKPPPAPKNEKMKQKRFFFGEQEDSEAKKEKKTVVPKLQIPSFPVKVKEERPREEGEIKTFEQVMGRGKFSRMLEIDTDTINKEFDIGGEKGKKLVDEDEEARQFEQEVLELADHCLLAMARHSPSEEVVSKYSLGSRNFANCGPITASNKGGLMQLHAKKPLVFPQSTKERKQFTFCLDTIEVGAATPIKEESLITSKSSLGRETIHLETEQSAPHSEVESLCLFLAYEMVGKKWMQGQSEEFSKTLNACLKHEIINLKAACALLKLASKAKSLAASVITLMLKLCEESDSNKKKLANSEKVLKKLLKVELGLYEMLVNAKVNKVIEFEQVIMFHASLIGECASTPNGSRVLEKAVLEFIVKHTAKPEECPMVCDCVKYLWGKTLTEINHQSSYPANTLHETTLCILILTNTLDKDNILSFSAADTHSAPVALYTDAELLKLVFEIVGKLHWKTEDLQDAFSSVNSANDVNLLEYLKKEQVELLTSESTGKHASTATAISLLLCIMLKNTCSLDEVEYWTGEAEQVLKYLLLILEAKAASSAQLQESIMLPLAALLQLSHSAAEEQHHFYAQALAHIFKFWFTLIRMEESKAKELYEDYLALKDGKLLVPVDEIYLMEGVTAGDLMRILTPEYGQLLEGNPSVADRLERAAEERIEPLKSELIDCYDKKNVKEDDVVETNEVNCSVEHTINLKDALKQAMRKEKWNKFQYIKHEGPLKLAGHQFANGLHCLLKKGTVKEDIEGWSKEYVDKLAKVLTEEMPEKLKKKIPPPMLVEASYNFNKFKGVLLVHKRRDPALVLLIYESNKKLCKKWKLADIKQLYRKGVKDVEMSFTGGRSALFSCESSEERDLLAKKLIRTREKWCTALNYLGTIDPAKGFRKAGLTEQWLTWTLPTLDYLLALNQYANKSFNDRLRYPILPYEPSVFPEYTISPNTILHNTRTVYSHFCDFDSRAKVPAKPLNAVPETYAIPFPLVEDEESHGREGVEYYRHIVQLHEGLEKNATAPNSIVTNWIDRNFGSSSEYKLLRAPHLSRSLEHGRSVWDLGVAASVEVFASQEVKAVHVQHFTSDDISQFLLFNEDGTIQSVKTTQRGTTIAPFAKHTTSKPWTKTIQVHSSKPPVKFLHRQKLKYIVQGGFVAGNIQLTPLFSDYPIISLNYHSSQVTALEVDAQERIGITGTKHGECIVFKLEEEMFWNPKHTLNDHGAEVTSIFISNEAELFVTGGLDGTLNVYTLEYRPKLLKRLQARKGDEVSRVDAVVIGVRPLPCVVVCSEGRLIAFSLAGEVLAEESEEANNLVVVRDSEFKEYVAYSRGEELVIRKLPYLEERVVARADAEISSVGVEGNQKAVLALDDGRLAYAFAN